jgi:hypothetical protein
LVWQQAGPVRWLPCWVGRTRAGSGGTSVWRSRCGIKCIAAAAACQKPAWHACTTSSLSTHKVMTVHCGMDAIAPAEAAHYIHVAEC